MSSLIDREMVLKLLEKYQAGLRVRNYITKVWEIQNFVLKQTGFLVMQLT